ncbi:hypothetical protein TcasGA2_TC006906 [Tribolium castaneum]|uniref:Integrase catalytic domain-containing protein n=1 Tax=Tribolium castaneum TaxID=7070 RepID=D7GXX1_TRICA|nr:hypothetical protein TcasGA2_TC006906 [Tribolium castaneum]
MPKTTVSLDKETTAAIFKSIIEAVTVPVAKLTPRNSSPLAAATTTNQGSTAAPKIRETEGSTVTSTPATEFRPASEVQPPMNTTVSVQTAVAGAVGSHVASTPRTTASLDKEVLAVTSETTTKARQVPNNQVFYHSKALEKGTPKRHDSPLAAKSEDTATSTPLQASACPASVSIDMPRHDKEIAEDEAPIEEPPPEPPPEVDKQDGISQEKILTIAEEVRQAQISDALTRRLINQRRDMEENPPEGNGWQSGFYKNIITDNGPQFTSSRWTKACQRWGCQPWTTATYTPRQNPTERRNQELKKLLKIHLHQKSQLDWDIQLPGILFTLRKRRNAATGQPPSCSTGWNSNSQANGMAQKREKRGPNLKLFANKREGTKNTTWRENSMWNPHIIHHPPTNLAISTRASATLNQINAMDALTEAIREQIDAARAQTQFHESLRTNNETPAPQEPLPLPEFFGENHEDPQRFLDTCLLRINNDNQEIRLQRIVSQLRGPAKEWWRLNGALIPTYEDFTAAFLNRYNGVSHLFKLKASLYGDASSTRTAGVATGATHSRVADTGTRCG